MEDRPKILIVDDKVENLIALEKIFADIDVELIRATSGNEALQKTIENDFALALIDVQIPDMDGFETVEIMRREEKTRYIPVIFISAIYSESYYQIKGIETGAIDFITKPVNSQVLVGKVRVHLELYRRRKELEEKNRELEDYNKLFANREFRIKELKERVEELEAKQSSGVKKPE